MYQNLINSLKKILDSKAPQTEKLLKISTLVDFADGLDSPAPYVPYPSPSPITTTYDDRIKPNAPITVDAKNPTGPGALVGVEDIK